MQETQETRSDTEILNFDVEIYGDVLNDGPKFVYDDMKKIVGAFTIKSGDTVHVSVPLKNNHYSLQLTSGTPFYFTPVEGPDGKISHAILSDVPIKPQSKKVELPPQ